MTVSTETNKVTYAGNGATTEFAFPFLITEDTDLRVVLKLVDNSEVVQLLTTNYTVSSRPWVSGGTITMALPPLTGETLLIKSSLPYTQEVDLRDGDSLPAETLEGSLDKLTRLIQQLREEGGRSVTLQEVTDLTGLTIPDPLPGTVLYSPDGLQLLWAVLSTISGAPALLPLSVPEGGTGANNAASARLNLGEQAGGSPFTRKHNYGASVSPTVNDDVNSGYSAGSSWWNGPLDLAFVCLDASPGEARWALIAASAGSGANASAGRNRVINGAMRISQRFAGGTPPTLSTNVIHTLDLWRSRGDVTNGVFTTMRASASPPPNFTHYLRATVTTADTSLIGGEGYIIWQPLEGLHMADLAFGTANAKTVTVSFYARSSIAGMHSGVLRGPGGIRSYPFAYTLAAPNVWEHKVITIPGDGLNGAGLWPTDTTVWGVLMFDMGAGPTVRGPADAWASVVYNGVTGAVSPILTLNATLDITGVQLEAGAVASAFEHITYDDDLQHCMRYFEKTFPVEIPPSSNLGSTAGALTATGSVTNVRFSANWLFKARKRASPTVVTYSPNAVGANWSLNAATTPIASVVDPGENNVRIAGDTSVGPGYGYTIHATAAAEL